MYRNKIYILLIFLLSIIGCSVIYAKEEKNNLPLFGKVIYIDPGHGGVDPGAIYKDLYESDINLDISLKLRNALESKGAIVYLTRDGDYDLSVPNTINRKRSDLSRRGNIINKSMCDLYLSIHLNAETSTTWYGAQVFYDDVNENNKELAEIMQKELKANFKTNRKVTEKNDLYLSKRIERPGVLIEVGFISNPNERYLLKQKYYQEKLANVITSGIIKYLKASDNFLNI